MKPGTAVGLVVSGLVVAVAAWMWRISPTSTGLANVPPPATWANAWRFRRTLDVVFGAGRWRLASQVRVERVNTAVGGDDDSAHLDGRAGDVTVAGLSIWEAEKQARASGRFPGGVLVHNAGSGDHLHLQIPEV